MPDDRDSAPLTPAPEPCSHQDAVSAEAAAVRLPLDFSGTVLVRAGLVRAGDAQDPPADAPGLAGLLVEHAFGDAAALLPSTEAAQRVLLETLRAHHRLAGRPKRRHLLVCAGAEAAPLPPEFASDAEVSRVAQAIGAIRAEVGPRTAGIFVSPLRLASGIEVLPGSFLADLREVADEYGLALVFDETDGGLGRTGMAFAHEWSGVTPDLMLVGEGAGLPVAALVLTHKVARGLPAVLPQVPTDALATAGGVIGAALAPGFEARVQGLGWRLEDRLAGLRYRRSDLFKDLVGLGMMQGLVCALPPDDLARHLEAQGLLARAIGAVLALLPPLDVTEAEIDAAADILDAVVGTIEVVPEPSGSSAG